MSDQKSNKKSKNSGSTPTPTAIIPNANANDLSLYCRTCRSKDLGEDCDVCLVHSRHRDGHFETELIRVKLIMESGQLQMSAQLI